MSNVLGRAGIVVCCGALAAALIAGTFATSPPAAAATPQTSGQLSGTIEVTTTWAPGASSTNRTLSATCRTTLTFDGTDVTREDSTFDWDETIVSTTKTTVSTYRIVKRGTASLTYRGSARAAYATELGSDTLRYRIAHPKPGGTIATVETTTLTRVANGRALPPAGGKPATGRASCWTPITPSIAGTGPLAGEATARSSGDRDQETTIRWSLQDCAAPSVSTTTQAATPAPAGGRGFSIAGVRAQTLVCGTDLAVVDVERCDPLPAGGLSWDAWFDDLYRRLGAAWQVRTRGMRRPTVPGYGLTPTIEINRSGRSVAIAGVSPMPGDTDTEGRAQLAALEASLAAVKTLPFPAGSKLQAIRYSALPPFVVSATNQIPRPSRRFVEIDGRLCYADTPAAPVR